MTDDPWVLDTVAEGLRINFISEPLQRSSPCDVSMSEEMQAVCKTAVKISTSVRQEVEIEEIKDGSAGFVCSFFCSPKKNGRA